MSRRSLLSAAVVPTATDEQLEDDDKPVQTVETDEQLDIELGESTMMRTGLSDSPATAGDSMEHQLPNAGAVPSRPLRTQSDVGSGAKLVKNYRGIVSSFKYLKPFTRGPDGKYPDKIVCVLCAAAKPTSVFFPCQHMCVCNKCIDENDMTPAYLLSLERCVCPVCREDIRLILPHTGDEEDKYWHWVQQTQSTLSVEFRNGFKMAGRRLSDSSVKETRELFDIVMSAFNWLCIAYSSSAESSLVIMTIVFTIPRKTVGCFMYLSGYLTSFRYYQSCFVKEQHN